MRVKIQYPSHYAVLGAAGIIVTTPPSHNSVPAAAACVVLQVGLISPGEEEWWAAACGGWTAGKTENSYVANKEHNTITIYNTYTRQEISKREYADTSEKSKQEQY